MEERDLTLDTPVRLDRAVARAFGLSRAAATAAITSGRVRVDTLVMLRPAQLVRGAVTVACIPEEPLAVPRLVHLYDDPLFVVVEKPAGLLTHRVGQRRDPTVVDALRAEGLELAGGPPSRIGVVHRLDRETSGVLLVACDAEAHAALQAQFAARTVEKHYRAITLGIPATEEGMIDAPIAVSAKRPATRIVADRIDARSATTHFRVLATMGPLALLDLRPFTGRTHQIRVHLAAIGCPVLGDRVYRSPRAPRYRGRVDRLMLHAISLAFDHPRSHERITVVSPAPSIFTSLLDATH